MHRIASVQDIRSHFPALERKHNDRPVAYFDGPGGTQAPRVVGDALLDYLYHHNANTHWAYPSSAETDTMLADARQAFGDFLNARPEEIAFGANMTTLTMHLARSIGLQMGPGDEIAVTQLDHHANIDPWRRLEKERGVSIRWVRMIPETGQLDWEHLQKCLTTKTRVLAIGAASNALGTVNDIRRAAALGHQVGARVFVDAVHYAPHFLPDVKEIDCDFLACSAYKFYGPHVGILYGKHDLLEELDVPRLVPAPDKHAERLETGTQNHEGIAGAAAAVNFLAGLHPEPSLDRRLRLVLVYDELEKRGAEQFGNLWNGLRTIEGVTLYGPSPEVTRTSTLSFTVNGKDSSDVSRRLADLGLFTSHGDFYATTVVEQLGLASQGLVRVGCACYTSEPEIEQLIGGVRSIV